MKQHTYIWPYLVLTLLLGACSSDADETFKQPVLLELKLDLDQRTVLDGALNFTGGTAWLSEFSFDGDRLQAEDLYFEREYEPSMGVDFNAGQSIPQLNFDIPQGTYSRIRVQFEMEQENSNSLIAYGRYKNSNGINYPLQLEVEDIRLYTVIAKNTQGNTEVNFNANFSSVGTIHFDPRHWFIDVSRNILDQASLVPIDGTLTLLINEDVNDHILDLVEDRLDEKVSFTVQ